MKDYYSIKSYFDKINKDTSHFENSNDICTPIDLVKEMVDTIPNEFWERENLKILDPCAGNGNFHAYILTKTKISNLYFNEINPKRIKNIKNYFGDDIKITQQDFLTFPEKEEYDLVVANPPYAKFNGNKRVSKNHNLSRLFIEKALSVTKLGGYILFVVPDNWMSLSDRNNLPKELSKYQFIHLNIHGAKKYFPGVGSSFTWFLMKKTSNNSDFVVENHYVLKDIQKVRLPQNMPFIPLYLSNLSVSIVQKTLLNDNLEKYKIETSSYLHRTSKKNYLSKEQNNEYIYKIIHTPKQIFYSKIPHKYQEGYKVFIPLTHKYKTFIDDCGMTQNVAYISCESYEDAKNISSQLNSEIFVFLNNITRYGNFNNIRILQKFPLINTISLTKEEIDLILKFNQFKN